MACSASFSIGRLRHAPRHEFSWADTSETSSADGQLNKAVYDSQSQHLYFGQSNGCISCVHINAISANKPKLLGRHRGQVTGLCLRPWRHSTCLLASCSADHTIKLFTHDPKAFHSNKALLQTLYGHAAAVTCIAAVHSYLLSGGADGAVLLWRPAEGNTLVQPLFQQVAQLWNSPQHWVLGLSCPLEPSEAGAGQGIFVAVANQPLVQLYLNKRAIQAAPAAKDSTSCLQPTSCCTVQLFAQTKSLLSATANCRSRGSSGCHSSIQKPDSCTEAATGAIASLHGPSSANNSLFDSRSGSSRNCQGSAAAAGASSNTRKVASSFPISSSQGTGQSLSIFAVQHVDHEVALLTLAYDGCCRVHSAIDGGLRSCWRSPSCSKFVSMACTGKHGEVLLGDEHGLLHVYSLSSERLLATKQLTQGRIADVCCCCSTDISGSSSGSSRGSSDQFAVLSSSGLGLWQLQRGLHHGILPGGHKQAVIALQVCSANVQVGSLPAVVAATAPAAAAVAASLPPQPPGDSSVDERQCAVSGAQAGMSTSAAAASCSLFSVGPQAAISTTATSSADSLPASAAALELPGDGENSSSSSNRNSSNRNNNSSSGSGSGNRVRGSIDCDITTTCSCSCMMLLSAGLDNKVLQWDLAGGPSVLASLDMACVGSELSAMTFLQGWAILATGHDNGQVLLWRLDTASHMVLCPAGHCNSVSCLAPALTAKGDELLLSGGFDGAVGLWEPRHLRGIKPHLLARFQAYGLSPEELLTAASLSVAAASSSYVSSSSNSSKKACCNSSNAAAEAAVKRLTGAAASISGICSRTGPAQGMSLPDINRCASWQQQQQQQQQQRQPASVPPLTLPQLAAAAAAAGGGDNSSSARCSSPAAQLQQQQLSRQVSWRTLPLQMQPGHSAGAGSAAANYAGAGCAASAGSAVAAAVGGNAAQVVEAPEVLAVVFDSLNQLVITGGNDGAIRVWNGGCSGELLGQHLGHTGPVNCLALDGNLLFSGSNDKTIRVWDVLPDSFTGYQRPSSSAGSSLTTPRPLQQGVTAAAAASTVLQSAANAGAAAAAAVRSAVKGASAGVAEVMTAASEDAAFASDATLNFNGAAHYHGAAAAHVALQHSKLDSVSEVNAGLSSAPAAVVAASRLAGLPHNTSFSSSQFTSNPASGAATYRSSCSSGSNGLPCTAVLGCKARPAPQQQQQPAGSSLNAVQYGAAGANKAAGSSVLMNCPYSIAFQVLRGHTAAVTGVEVVAATGLLVSCGRDGRLIQFDYSSGRIVAQHQLPSSEGRQELLCLSVRQDSRQVFVGTSTAQVLSFVTADAPAAAEEAGLELEV